VATSPAQLKSRSTAADDGSDVLYLMKTVWTAGHDRKLDSEVARDGWPRVIALSAFMKCWHIGHQLILMFHAYLGSSKSPNKLFKIEIKIRR